MNEEELDFTSASNQLDDTLAGMPDSASLIRNWLDEKNWTTPKWYGERQRTQELKSYETYFAHRLRSRYFELESDFRTLLSNEPKDLRWIDVYSADRIFAFLSLARQELEQENPNLLEASHLLDLVDRYMPWIMPPQVLVGRRYGILSKLRASASEETELVEKIASTMETTAEDYWKGNSNMVEVRGYLDQAIGIINRHNLEVQIGAGLQIERLKSLRFWGGWMLLILLLTSPLTIGSSNVISSEIITGSHTVFSAWMVAIGIIVIGASGGFLSGLLQVRESEITLTEYQESVLKFHLKPLVGAILALLLFVLLSWQILPGISIENTGSYILFAFLAGYSERYFLSILQLKKQGIQPSESSNAIKTTTIEEK